MSKSYFYGLLVCFLFSVWFFNGVLAAAVFQLTGILWMGFNFWRLDKYDN